MIEEVTTFRPRLDHFQTSLIEKVLIRLVHALPQEQEFATHRIIACIDDPVVIEKILAHLQEKLTPAPAGLRPESRAPPTDLSG